MPCCYERQIVRSFCWLTDQSNVVSRKEKQKEDFLASIDDAFFFKAIRDEWVLFSTDAIKQNLTKKLKSKSESKAKSVSVFESE